MSKLYFKPEDILNKYKQEWLVQISKRYHDLKKRFSDEPFNRLKSESESCARISTAEDGIVVKEEASDKNVEDEGEKR